MRRDESQDSFAIIRYNFRTYESGGVMAVIKGRGNAEMKIEHFQGGQSKEDRNAGWRYFLEKTGIAAGRSARHDGCRCGAAFDLANGSHRETHSNNWQPAKRPRTLSPARTSPFPRKSHISIRSRML